MDSLSRLLFDVQFQIFLLLDAKDILAVGATCKALQRLANHRQVWMAYLRGLSEEYAPDLPPHVDVGRLSGPEIKNVVIRAMIACDNWNNEYSEANREATLRVKNPGGKMGDLREEKGRIVLVPGGEYVMVHWSRGFLQCYHVPTSECVWEISQILVEEEVTGLRPEIFDVDLVVSEGSQQLMVVVVFSLGKKTDSIRVMELYKVDTQLRESATIARKILGREKGLAPQIRGDVLLVLSPAISTLYLGNWKKGQFAATILPFHPYHSYLLKDHVICAGVQASSRQDWKLCVISVLQMLAGADSELRETPFYDAVLTSIKIHEPPGVDIGRSVAQLFCCEPTWRKERVVSIYVVGKDKQVHPNTQFVDRFVYKYELDFDNDYSNPTLNSVDQPVCVRACHYKTTFNSSSQSGRGLMRHYNYGTKRYQFIPYSIHQMLKDKDDGNLDSGALRLDAIPESLHMEHYSGHVAFVPSNSTSIIIKYYD